MNRKPGFTLIEVLAALGIIIVLTMTLVVTIKGQIDRANKQNLTAAVETMNMQIDVAYQQTGRNLADFASVNALKSAGIISASQADQAAAMNLVATPIPPHFELK